MQSRLTFEITSVMAQVRAWLRVGNVASIVLTVGRGETTIGEKVDPRRAQVAQVGEREESCVFTQ